MLARPKAWFSNDWLVTDDHGREVLLDLSVWRERGCFELDGVTYELSRESGFGDFTLRAGDRVLAAAEKPSALRNRFDLVVGDDRYELRKSSVFARRFEVRRGETPVGEIAPEGVFYRRSHLQLPPEWPLPVRLFVFWLAAIVWQRERQAAAAG